MNKLLKRLKLYEKKWEKLSQIHAKSKISKIKNHVTLNEHITGERLSYIDGYIAALEWIRKIYK